MFDTLNGVPTHPLVVHAVVVLVPAAALAVLLFVAVPRFRRWSGLATPLLATAAAALIPVATASGESLEEQVAETALVERHAELGEALLPWAVGLAVLAWVLWWLARPATSGRGSRSTLLLGVGVLAIAVAVGSGIQVYRIGHSGAESVWSDTGGAPSTGDDD